MLELDKDNLLELELIPQKFFPYMENPQIQQYMLSESVFLKLVL